MSLPCPRLNIVVPIGMSVPWWRDAHLGRSIGCSVLAVPVLLVAIPVMIVLDLTGRLKK